MSLAAGSQLGPYEILSHLGAGGMGVVYKARDTRLGREVAIKVLPEGLSGRADVRERFVREARAISSLSHPHICPLYDVGSQDGIDYLVMEYLEGETLAHRLKKGALPLDQALRYGIEIASALDSAHRKGITHRDLKPGNVMLTKSGTKLLDFGLARMHARGQAAGGSAVATQTEPMTAEGTIIGTLQYMAPEQLEGKDSDARTDIFAFGATLYEMATGRRAFEGLSSASLIAAIMHTEPAPISTLKPVTPPLLDRLVRECLAKDPEERGQTAHDLLRELKWIAEEKRQIAESSPARRGRRLAWTGLVVLAAAVIAGLAFWMGRGKGPEPPELNYLTYSGHDFQPAASPDGRTIAFVSDRDGRARIWLKELANGGEASLTEGPDFRPRFSPDGSMILFTRGELPHLSLYRIALVGGESRKVMDDVRSADWSPDGRQIVFVRRDDNFARLLIANVDGSGQREVVRFENQTIQLPRWSPDGRAIAAVQNPAVNGVTWLIFRVGVDGKDLRKFSSSGYNLSSPEWLAGSQEVVYSENEVVGNFPSGGRSRLIRRNLTSGAAQVVLRVPQNIDGLDVIGAGRIVLATASPRQSLRETPLGGKLSAGSRWLTRGNSQDRQPAYSPDGEWVIFSSTRSGNKDLWKISTKTGVVRRLTDDPAEDWDPAFTPDGKKIIWSSRRGGNLEIWMADADGSGARQVTHDGSAAENPTPTPDGKWIVYVSNGNPAKQGLWKIHPDGSEPSQLISGRITLPEVSPDGQYALYTMGGIRFVRIADGADVHSGMPAGRPRWMPDGRAVAFLCPDEKGLTGVCVQDFTPGQDTTKARRKLAGFDPDMPVESFGISPDGTRITISYADLLQSLMVAEGVPGIEPPARRAR